MSDEPLAGVPSEALFVGVDNRAVAAGRSRGARRGDLRSSDAPTPGSSRRVRALIDSWIDTSRRISGWKILLTLGCFLAAAYFLGPRVFFTYSEEAVTNAPLVTLAPALPGTVASIVPRLGQEIGDGDAVAVIDNPLWDPTPVLDIDQRLRGAQSRIEAGEKTIAGLTAIRSRLQHDYDVWRQAETRTAGLQVTAASERLAAAQARFHAAEVDLARYEGLAPAALVNHQRLTDVQRDYAVAQHDVAAAQAQLDEAKQQQKTIVTSGITLSWDDRPPTLQRIDEIDIRLASERANLAAARADADMLERQRAERLRQRERERQQVLRSPVHGVIWRLFARPGDVVAAHAPVLNILDCNRLGVSATFNQRYLDSIVPGRAVSVRLVGVRGTLAGHIVRVSGYYTADYRQAEAIAMKPDAYAPVIAWISFDKPPAECLVGLKATVRLE